MQGQPVMWFLHCMLMWALPFAHREMHGLSYNVLYRSKAMVCLAQIWISQDPKGVNPPYSRLVITRRKPSKYSSYGVPTCISFWKISHCCSPVEQHNLWCSLHLCCLISEAVSAFVALSFLFGGWPVHISCSPWVQCQWWSPLLLGFHLSGACSNHLPTTEKDCEYHLRASYSFWGGDGYCRTESLTPRGIGSGKHS